MRVLFISVFVLAACQQGKSKLDDVKPTTATKVTTGSGATPASDAPPAQDIDSKAILSRTETTPEVQVKHVLIGWKDLTGVYQGHMDPRAAKRSNADAAKLAQDIAAKLQANPDQIDALVKESSEDPGSLGGEPYVINSDTPFVPEFKTLALRLKEKEVGIVKTQFGYHVIERVVPPPPDPLESSDIMGRPVKPGAANVYWVLIGWKDAPMQKRINDPRAAARSKEDADKLAKDVLEKARGGADFSKLIKDTSEDPGAKDTAKPMELTAQSPMVEPVKKLALRLNENEVGMVKTPFGWFVIKRVAPPPPPPAPAPDALDSVDILKRKPVTEKAKVKHILLGWKEVNADDPRAKARDRATLEKLVKDTLAKLKSGTKIEKLMADLSEDPGSAKSGDAYPVTPDAGLVEPFKNLSLRLNVGEVGVVKSQFGIHIIQRTE